VWGAAVVAPAFVQYLDLPIPSDDDQGFVKKEMSNNFTVPAAKAEAASDGQTGFSMCFRQSGD